MKTSALLLRGLAACMVAACSSAVAAYDASPNDGGGESESDAAPAFTRDAAAGSSPVLHDAGLGAPGADARADVVAPFDADGGADGAGEDATLESSLDGAPDDGAIEAAIAIPVPPRLRLVTTGDSIVAQGNFQYWMLAGYGAPDGGLSLPEAFPGFDPTRSAFMQPANILPAYQRSTGDYVNLGQASDTALGWCLDAPASGGPYDAGYEMTSAVLAAQDSPAGATIVVTFERGTNDLAPCGGALPHLESVLPGCIATFRARVGRPITLLCQTLIDRDTSETPACADGGFTRDRHAWNSWLASSGLCDGIIPVGDDPVIGCDGCMTDAAAGPLSVDGIHPTSLGALEHMTPYYVAALETATHAEAPVTCGAAPPPALVPPSAGASCTPAIASTLPDLASALGSPAGDLTVRGTCLSATAVSVGGIAMECAETFSGPCAGAAAGACLQCTVPPCTQAPLCCLTSEGTAFAGQVAACNANGCGTSCGEYPAAGVTWVASDGLEGLWTPQVVTCAAGRATALPDHAGGGWTLTPTKASGGPLCETAGGGASGDQPYLWSPDTTVDRRMHNAAFPTSYNAHELQAQFRREGIVTSLDALLSLGEQEFVVEWGSPDGGAPDAGSYGIGQYGGLLGAPYNVIAAPIGSDFHLDSLFADAVSGQRLNGGDWVRFGAPSQGPAVASTLGIYTSTYYADSFIGRLGTFAAYGQPETKRAQDNWDAYFARHGW